MRNLLFLIMALISTTISGNNSFVSTVNDPADKEVSDQVKPVKTKVLESNKVRGKNILTQGMMSEIDTKYVLKYEYDLEGRTIKIPKNSSVEFDGGKLKNGAVNFTELNSSLIFSSWMDTETLLNSVGSMSYKTLVIDGDITLNRPISNMNDKGCLINFSIIGKDVNEHNDVLKNHVRIFCNNCSAIAIKGYDNVIKDISFLFSKGGGDNAFIKLDTGGPGVSDLDAIIDNCSFYTDDHTAADSFKEIRISNAIVTYGRGLRVKDCTFNGAVKDSYLKCYMKAETQRTNPSVDEGDKYGGRAFWFHHNRIHMNVARFVHFAVNESAPKCVFRGIRIENNLADVGGSLGLFEAPSYNTFITGNTFMGGVHYSLDFLTLTDANEVKVDNNVFRAFDNDDLPSFMSNNYCIKIIGNKCKELKDISICNNLITCREYFINVNVPISGLIANNNIFNDQSFTTDSGAILRSLKTSKDIIISGNINSSLHNKEIDSFKAFDVSAPKENLENIIISDNIGCKNWITSFGNRTNYLKGRSFTNIIIKYDKLVCPDEIMDECSLIINVRSKKGFTYTDGSLSPVRNIIWSGTKWIEQDGASAGVRRSGSFSQKPSGADVYVGFQYYCTDKKSHESNQKGLTLYWNGSKWTDALGRTIQ